MCAVKSIQNMCRCGMDAQESGDHAGAVFLLHQALRQAGGLSSPILEAKILNSLGIICILQGKKREAAPYLTRALEKVEKRVGTTNKLYAVIEKNLRQTDCLQAAGG